MSRRRIRRRRRRRINSCPFISSTVRITCGQWPLGRVKPHSTIPSPGRGWRPAAPSYWPLGYRLAESSCGTVAQVCHLYWLFIVARGWINVRGFLGPPLLMNFHLQELVTKIWIDISCVRTKLATCIIFPWISENFYHPWTLSKNENDSTVFILLEPDRIQAINWI